MARDKDLPQVWQSYGGGGGSGIGGRYLRDMTASEIAAREAMQKPYADMLARQQRYEDQFIKQTQKEQAKPDMKGCVFAKSCNLPDGVINYSNPSGFVPVERLAHYGLWAVLGTGAAVTSHGTQLQLLGGSASGSAIAQRLGGTLALTLLKEASIAIGSRVALRTVALLIPNTSLSPDSAFYTNEQYATLSAGRTRVRVNSKRLPDGSVSVYGFYTGGKKDWENVPVVEAQKDGEKYVADIGNGIGLTWTPASPDGVLGIPALEGASPLPPVWVYPPTEQADKILVNPTHPPDYQDAIITFPGTGIQPIYISLSMPGDHGYHPAPKGLTAFPDAKRDKSKNSVQGGGKRRARWKDSRGRIYEWDNQHGAVEIYDKQGKHLGEYNPETGEQTKPAKPGRTTPK